MSKKKATSKRAVKQTTSKPAPKQIAPKHAPKNVQPKTTAQPHVVKTVIAQPQVIKETTAKKTGQQNAPKPIVVVAAPSDAPQSPQTQKKTTQHKNNTQNRGRGRGGRGAVRGGRTQQRTNNTSERWKKPEGKERKEEGEKKEKTLLPVQKIPLPTQPMKKRFDKSFHTFKLIRDLTGCKKVYLDRENNVVEIVGTDDQRKNAEERVRKFFRANRRTESIHVPTLNLKPEDMKKNCVLVKNDTVEATFYTLIIKDEEAEDLPPSTDTPKFFQYITLDDNTIKEVCNKTVEAIKDQKSKNKTLFKVQFHVGQFSFFEPKKPINEFKLEYSIPEFLQLPLHKQIDGRFWRNVSKEDLENALEQLPYHADATQSKYCLVCIEDPNTYEQYSFNVYENDRRIEHFRLVDTSHQYLVDFVTPGRTGNRAYDGRLDTECYENKPIPLIVENVAKEVQFDGSKRPEEKDFHYVLHYIVKKSTYKHKNLDHMYLILKEVTDWNGERPRTFISLESDAVASATEENLAGALEELVKEGLHVVQTLRAVSKVEEKKTEEKTEEQKTEEEKTEEQKTEEQKTEEKTEEKKTEESEEKKTEEQTE